MTAPHDDSQKLQKIIFVESVFDVDYKNLKEYLVVF